MLFLLFGILFVIGIYLFLICPNLSRREQMKRFFNTEFAHRGYFSERHLIPENSMAAFHEAVKHHLGIELDVHLTKDKQIVVFHDDTLTRMCQAPHTVEEMTYKELNQFYLNHTSEKIPLFSDVLHYVNGRVPLLIELKLPTKSTVLCEEILQLLQKYPGPFLIQSFNTLGILWFRKHAPHILRGQLSSNLTKTRVDEPWIACLFVRFLLINCMGKPDFISYKLKDASNISLQIIKILYRIPIAVWTLRTKEAFQKGKNCYQMVIFERF